MPMGRNDFPLIVIADDRERKGEIIQFLSEMKNVSLGIKRLSLGDYVVDNRLVFERKTLQDFALSIIDGRLFRQAMSFSGSYPKTL
jgi:ERCC4-type nuclease